MKATLWLVPVLMCAACGGGSDGPRGAGGTSSFAGTGGAGAAGVGGSPGGAGVGGAPVAGAGAGGTAGTAGQAMGGAGAGGMDTGPVTHPDQRTVVYLPTYRGVLSTWATKMPWSQVTYVNPCFADVSAGGDVTFSDPSLDTFVTTAHQKGAKVCVAIGGASVIGNGGVFATVLQDGTRDMFVGKLSQFASDHKLDCIDVDLEGEGVNQYYEAFVTSLAAKLHSQNMEMTAAVSSWFGQKITDKAIAAFDFMNIMAYDLHNPQGTTTPEQSASVQDATAEVDYWVNRGLAKNKAVYGVPFYGYSWAAGQKPMALTYAEILAKAPTAATQDQVTVDGNTVYLNSRMTVQAKAVLGKTYGGTMVWEIGQDAAGDASLLKAIDDATM